MALLDPLFDLAGTIIVVAGLGLVFGGVPYAYLTGQSPVLLSGLKYVSGGGLYLVGGVLILSRTYDAVDISGFESRPGGAIWATIVLVAFGTYLFP